jgi:hypothetical protein
MEETDHAHCCQVFSFRMFVYRFGLATRFGIQGKLG